MAQKRMFSNLVVGSDEFLEMPDSSQNLYFHLSMQADDDGFVDNWKSILRMTGKKEDDLKILIAKSFVLPFNSGVLVIKHWKLNNYIQKDRYKETLYKNEKSKLVTDENNVYNLDTECIHSIDKNRLDKSSIEENSSSSEYKDRKNIVNDSCVDDLHAIANDSCANDLQNIANFYNSNIGILTPYGLEILADYAKDMPEDLIIFAMKKALEADVRNIKYIKGILNSWSKKGIKTLVEAQKEDENFRNKGSKKEETEEQKNLRKIKELEDSIKNGSI